MRKLLFLNVIFLAVLVACSDNDGQDEIFSADLEELTDAAYPDNPDISVRHEKYVSTSMKDITFNPIKDGFDIVVAPDNSDDDTVMLSGISLMEFIPSIPNYVKSDEYMSLIAVTNQEWNRNQVRWEGEDLNDITGETLVVNGETITRIDLARNCLNAYLWELFFYTDVEGKNKVFYHGWFTFPKSLYQDLYEERNSIEFKKYRAHLVYWTDPPSEHLDLTLIRNVQKYKEVRFVNHDEEMYPIAGERKKKQIEVIYPVEYSKMSDFHTDSSLFATFSPPGYYNRDEPRTTQLGRFQSLKKVVHAETKSVNGDLTEELQLTFQRDNGEETEFIFGGLHFDQLPQLDEAEANSGRQFSMGIGNHPFYENCEAHESFHSNENPYFAVLLDSSGNWLDSHKIGIDGPLIHRDIENPNILHVWLLSFERHALVGHYEIELN